MVRQDAESAGIADAIRVGDRADAAGGVGLEVSRRKFLVGAGVALATTSVLGPWLKKAAATTSSASSLDGFNTGVSDAFDELAQNGGPLALNGFDALVAANAQSIRFPIDWARVQPAEGGFDWSSYDALYQVLVFHGLKAHPVLIGCPEWVGSGQRKRAANGVYYPTGARSLDAYGEFAIEASKHFSYFGGQIDAIEVWSEPNNPRGAHIADPSEYSRMLATVARSVDRANADGTLTRGDDRSMTVLSGGLYAAPGERSW